MRIITMLLFTVILGAAGFGAWIIISSESPPPLPGSETKQSGTPAEQAFQAKQAKWRDAPYVILAPAQTLPEKQTAAPPPPTEPKLAAPRVAPPPAPRPQAAPQPVAPPPAAKSSIAKLALETVIGPQATLQPETEAAPQPAPQQIAPKLVAKAPAPLLTPPASTAAPAPTAQQTAAVKKKHQLPYETKVNSRSKAIVKQQSLLAQDQVRFRRPVPISSGTLKSSKMTITLAGLDGLVADAQCKYVSGKSWDCGRWGKYALRRLIRGRSITCDVVERVTENIVSARCKVAGVDINKWVVRRGWGRPLGEGADKYDVALKAAKQDKLGQWSIESAAN